ncbi:MAG: 30S ribosomal protein S9 [bacterium]
MTNRIFAVGSRKSATVRVWLDPGNDERTVNGRSFKDYFGRSDLVENALAPLRVAGTPASVGVTCRAAGGGISAQAEAIALGIARALTKSDPELRKPLKDAEFLKRDPREHERMKYGLAKRRKRFQWTKR